MAAYQEEAAHKLSLIHISILGEMGVEVVLPSDVGVDVDVEETGTTFAENAALKANAIMAEMCIRDST